MNLLELENILSNNVNINTEVNRQMVLENLDNPSIVNILKNILDDEFQLLNISKRSYRHSNGFDKILLIDKRPYYALRLHIWNPINSCDGHIHNHEWDLSGVVLFGSYRWELYEYENSENIDGLYYYECKYNKNYSQHLLTNEKKVLTKKIFDVTMAEKSFYNLKSSICHKITMSNEYCASLMLHGNSLNQKIVVISNNKLMNNLNESYIYYSVQELAELLKNVIIKMERK